MKRIFNHTKRTNENWKWNTTKSSDWDAIEIEEEDDFVYQNGGDYEEEVEEFYGDTEELYGEPEEYYEDADAAEYAEGAEEYYEGDETVEYAEETEEFYEGAEAYYEDADTAEYVDGEEAYYEDAAEYAEGAEEFYEEPEEYYEDVEEMDMGEGDPEPVPPAGRLKKRTGFGTVFFSMGMMDRIMLAGGVCILVLAAVLAVSYVRKKTVGDPFSQFASVGTQLDGIEIIGDKGLLAVVDAAAKRFAAEQVQQEQGQETEHKGYQENEYSRDVRVTLKMVSVQKDLKIKFVNKDTDKLIPNVPFTVNVTMPDGKTQVWSDDDMDGIIYKKGITPGDYKVAVSALEGEAYAKYSVPSEVQKAEVKKDIAYKKIDVANEVKTESQINVATEEQKKQTPVVESTLGDTVEWVESTVVTSTYIEVAKSAITDPTTVVKSGSFMRMANEITLTSETGSFVLTAGGASLRLIPNHSFPSVTSSDWSSNNPSVASVDNGVVTPYAAGSAMITYRITVPDTTTGGDAQLTYEAGCMVTVAAAPLAAGTVSVNPSAVTVSMGAKGTVQAVAAGFTGGRTISYGVACDNPGVATAQIDGNGLVSVTGVAVGTATLTVTANYAETPLTAVPSAVISVTVTDVASISLDKTAMTVYLSAPAVLNATVKGGTAGQVSAESSDTSVATVSVADKAVTVTGVKAGTATVTVGYTENGKTVSASCAVTVKQHPKDDTSTPLKDNSGNELFVLENNEYRVAVYADYYKDGVKFFKRGEAKYTGWQTLDGKVYFFDAAGRKVTGEQVIQGAKYHFASDGSLVTDSGTMGIDVSKHNANINWEAVKNSGVSYVIIRCGYRGYTQGAIVVDPKFEQNIKGATAAGLKVGVYFFSQAVDEVEAVEEASFVLDCVRNYAISYPVFLDVEPSGAAKNKGRADGLDKGTRTAVCKAFCATISSGGYTAGIYANKTWLETKIDPGQLGSYKIWLAQYAAEPTYRGRYDLWQYKSTGRVSGISGNVDMNMSYLGY